MTPSSDHPRNAASSAYWSDVADTWDKARRQALWRAFSDSINGALLDAWLPQGGVARILKTDSFDEVVSGGLYPRLACSANEVIGMDISVRAATLAHCHYPSFAMVAADVRRLPFAGDSFDVIVSNSTLDHFASLDELAQSLNELRRILRPGGVLLLTLDNLANPAVALRNALPFALNRRLGLVPYFVGATCGPSRLQAMLASAGFEIDEMRAIVHCPRVLAVALGQLLDRYGSQRARAWYLRHLAAYERLGALPTRFLTGYFSAVRAVRSAR